MKSRMNGLAEIPWRWKLSGQALWPRSFSASQREPRCAPTSQRFCNSRMARFLSNAITIAAIPDARRSKCSGGWRLAGAFLPFIFFPVVHLQLRCRSETLWLLAKDIEADLRGILLRSSVAGAGGVNSLGSRGVTEDVELQRNSPPITSHSIAFVRLLCTFRGRAQSGKHLNCSAGEDRGALLGAPASNQDLHRNA